MDTVRQPRGNNTVPEVSRGGAGTWSAATLHEAAGRCGALPARIKPVDPSWRLAGPAFPVTSAAGDNLWLHHAIYAAQPGDVLVVAIRGGEEFGYWGEIMSEAALARSLGGLVIDGPVRDAGRLRALGFPVFATGLCIRGTEKNPGTPGGLGDPIMLGTVLLQPGDLVVGDEDGVVAVPRSDVNRVLAAAEEREAKEATIVARLRAGESTHSIYGLPEIDTIQ